MDAKTDAKGSGKCPVPHSRGRQNRDWWPNQVNVSVLHQNTPGADPMGGDFDYVREFESLDLDAVTVSGERLADALRRVMGYHVRPCPVPQQS